MAVKYAALEEFRNDYAATDDWRPMAGAIVLEVKFRLPRPKGHYGTGRNAGLLKPSAPFHPAGRPDLDKLLRSTFDALGEAGVWGDDSQVVTVRGQKVYATDYEPTGATIRVMSLVNVIERAVA
jgi:crossover junction endodeoxyribonuclease RusA